MWFAYLIRLVDLVGWWNLILSIIFLSVAHRISVARSIGVHFLVLMVLMIVVVVPFMILGGMTLLAHLTNHGM
jgi:hypothetical protein